MLFIFLITFLCINVSTAQRDCDIRSVKVTVYPEAPAKPRKMTFDKALVHPKKIFGIEITGQNITKLCYGAFDGFKYLYTIKIHYSELREVHAGVFNHLEHLDILDLSNNEIPRIESNVFSNSKIRILRLSNNSISIIEESFHDMPNLEVLELDDNFIYVLQEGWFKNSQKLHTINLDHNSIEELPSEFFIELNTTFKDTKKNIKFPFGFTKLYIEEETTYKPRQNDIHLSLAYNNLRNLGINWSSFYRRFSTVDFSNNNFTKNWELKFHTIEHIGKLNLENNRLECLNGKDLEEFKGDEIYLDGNDVLSCGCFLNLQDYVRRNRIEVYADALWKKCEGNSWKD